MEAMKCSEKMHKNKNLILKTVKASLSMLNVKSSKRTWQHSLGSQVSYKTNHKTTATMSFGQMKPKWK